MLGALTLLLAFQLLGEILSFSLGLPIPGPVLGMLGLFGFLVFRGSVSQPLQLASQDLLNNLSLMFVPAGVGVIVYLDVLQSHWLGLTFLLIFSTGITIIGTALVLQLLLRLPTLFTRQQSEEAHEH
jgi:holin-like protein